MPKVVDDVKIFKTVLKLFISLGYHGTTTKEIAKLTGINEVTLFRKYGNKLNLVKLSFEYQFSVVPFSKIVYTGNLHADLLNILEAYVDTNEAIGNIVPMVLLEIPRFPELKSTLDVAISNMKKLAEIIKRYQDEGFLKKESALVCANNLISPILINNMFRRAQVELPESPINLNEYVDTFLHGRLTNKDIQ